MLPLEEGWNNRTATTVSYEGTVALKGQTKHSKKKKKKVANRPFAGLVLGKRNLEVALKRDKEQNRYVHAPYLCFTGGLNLTCANAEGKNRNHFLDKRGN